MTHVYYCVWFKTYVKTCVTGTLDKKTRLYMYVVIVYLDCESVSSLAGI